MTYLAKVRKCDLSKLAYELGEVVPPESRIVDLKHLISNSQSYEEEFAKQLLETLIEDRERIEERERIDDRKRIEDRERIERERKEQMVMEFELEKLRIQTTRGNNDTSRSTSNDAHYEIRKLMPKYESKDNDLSFYLILFERQAKRLGLDEDQWAFSLLGLLPYEMTQLIARETEEQSGDYRFVKRLLLKRYKLSPEQFRQKFEKHERSQKGSWRDFAFELRGYFNEWIEGMNLNNPDELADKLDEYENVRTEMGPPHWNAKHLIPPSFQQKSVRFPNQSEVKETKQGTNVSGQDAARNEISETYPNTLRRMVNRTIRNDKGEPKCFNCNQFGHIARDCPAPRTTLTCRGCGQTGHKERNCTRPKEGLKVANLEVEGLETVPPDVYLKDVKIDNKETVKAMIDTGSSSCLMRESVARRISVDIEPDSTSLYGIGNQTAPAARTVGKTTVDLEIGGIVGREITVFIVNDDAQPYDLLIGRTWTDLPYVSFARIGKNLHIGYSSEFPFANLQEEIKSRRIELRATETVQLESDSINFTSAITDEVKDGYVLFTGVDDACVDSLLEVVDGKTTVPIISAGKGKLRVRKNQCVGRVELLNLDDIVVNLDVAEDSFQTKNEEKREGQDQMKRKRPILPEDINVNHSLTSKERQEILDVVNEYRDCFALGMEELGCTDVTKMDIKEVDGSKPVCLRPYKTTASEREAIREIVREWKDNGIVTETRSPYASPVLLVRKKTGDHRLVVDYRRLNIQTVKDKFPLPRIDDLLEGLRNAKFFTTLDLAHGYLQIPLTDKAKLKTAFITPDDTGQFERMIFGLANAPAEFQRLMHTVLGPLLNKKAFCYLDDVIIPAKDWREMIERLREVLERIRSAKLTLKPSKCEFGRKKVEFLGYVISTGGLKPGPRKIKAIEEFPEPKNVHDIRRFLGLTNFFRRFVKDFARKAEPLSRLTKKGSQFEWKEEQRRSFGGLRKDLVEYPVLAHYNPELKTEVHCDASAEGLAGMVLQMDEDCKWRLVYCVSKKTTEAEKMYHSSKLELMAIVWTLDRLRQFLVGIKFTVVTDCQALVYMNAKKTTNPQIARWYNLIQEYDFEIRHKPGEKMAHVDGMSRAPVDDPRDTMEEIVEKNLEVCLTITLEEQILMIQHSDPELRDLIQIFRKDPCDRTVGEQNRINDYSYKGGRLFRMVKNGEEERALYVIPKSMRKSLVVKFHDLMGHFATDRTVNKIKELYWFPSMKRYVRRHVAMCLECLFNKVPGGKQQGFLHPIKSGKRPFSIVHMDHVGPFVRSTKGNQELLVIVDNLTRFVRLSPVRNTSTQNVLKVMKSFVNDFGLPDKIISDRGSCFTSRQFEEFCRGKGIHHTLNSTKHPQGNGMVERVNRTVLSTIATSIEDPRRKDWDLKIKEVERDLNNAVNKTTNKTPFETLHGYSPRFHDGILRRLADEDVDPWTEPDRIQKSVRSQIENKQEIMKTYYDKKRCRTIQFEVGEIVVMRHVPKMTGEPTKAQPKYRGPLIITEALPSDTYRVTQLSERTSGRFYTTTAHISQLKSWHSEEDDSATEESPDEEPEVEDTPRRNPRRSCNARFNRGRLKSRNGRIKKRLRKPTPQKYARSPSDFVEAKHNVKHYIPTRGQPIHSKARRLDPQRLTLAKAEFQYILNNGIIRPSNSPWASPLHLVSKKDESLRPCGDYRRLNAVALPDRYPIPRLDDFHHILKEAELDEETPSENMIITSYKLLEKYMANLQDEDKLIWNLMLDDEEKDTVIHYDEKWMDLEIKINHFLSSLMKNTEALHDNSSEKGSLSGTRVCRLPKLDLKICDGSSLEFRMSEKPRVVGVTLMKGVDPASIKEDAGIVVSSEQMVEETSTQIAVEESEKAQVEKKHFAEESKKAQVEKRYFDEESKRAQVEKKCFAEESKRAQVEKRSVVEVNESHRAEVEKGSVEADEEKGLDVEQGMDSKNTEEVKLLYAEQGTDSNMAEGLDAGQGGLSFRRLSGLRSLKKISESYDCSKPSDDTSGPSDVTSEPSDDTSGPSDDTSRPSDDTSKPADDASASDPDSSKAETQAILHEYLRGAKKKDRSEIKWTEEAEVQFEQCKQALANIALLAYPDAELPISLCTDASDRAVGKHLRMFSHVTQRSVTLPARIQPPETFDFSTPNEWPKWRKRFERYLVVSGMKKKEEADKIDLFMYLMGDRADDIFRTFKFEKEEEATKFDSVLKAFDSHFCVRKNIIYERAKFNSRIQEDREPVDEFITSLYKLADSCEFEGLHEQLIRDRIVVGVRDKALSERMQLDSELTLEKAVKMVRQQQVDLQRPSTSQKVNQVKFNSKKQSPKQQQQPSRKKEKSAKTRSRCPKCGDKQAKTAEVKAVSELDEEIGFLLEVSAVEDSSNLDDDERECRRRWTAEIQANGKKVKFKLDSQADVTCVPLRLFKKIMGQQRLVKSDINLRAAEISELQTVGMFISTLRNGNYEIKEKIYVIRRLGEPLLSRRACELLNLARRIEVVATRINPIKEFPEVFEGLGQIGNPYEIKLKPGAKPYAVHTPRRVPIPLMEKLKTRLDVPGKELLDADALSRQPLLTTEGGEDERPTSAHINAVLSSITDKDEMLTKIFEAQQEDTTLKAVVNYLEQGWPDKKKMSQALLSYWHVKDELGVQNGLLMRSCRLVIPASMKLEILDKLHAGHFGITKTRLRARETVWWPGISEEIAETVRKCSVCIQEAVSKHEPLIPTNFPTRPWQKIGMDLFKFENKWYLVVIDYYSRFPEMVQLDRLTASVVVRSCKSIFARHGVPETVSNGMAEAGVKIAKLILKKNQDPSLGLLEYRSTPLENGYSPAELLMGRKLRTTLPIAPDNLNPKLVDSQTLKRKEGRRRKDMKSRYDRRCGATDMGELSEGDTVWITDMRTWGIVKQKASTPRSYMVDTPVGTLRRNRFHLRKGVTVQYPADPSTPTFSGEELVENEKTPVVDYPSNDSEDGQIRTQSGRIVKP
ncbi:hypothetical protein LAZ67_13001327, partial [Cordylochernes scorpioides]